MGLGFKGGLGFRGSEFRGTGSVSRIISANAGAFRAFSSPT